MFPYTWYCVPPSINPAFRALPLLFDNNRGVWQSKLTRSTGEEPFTALTRPEPTGSLVFWDTSSIFLFLSFSNRSDMVVLAQAFEKSPWRLFHQTAC
jgi:hypothetical protein